MAKDTSKGIRPPKPGDNRFIDNIPFTYVKPKPEKRRDRALTAETMQRIMLEIQLGRKPARKDTAAEKQFRSTVRKQMKQAEKAGQFIDFVPEFPDLLE